MYQLSDSLARVKGVGEKTTQLLQKQGLITVKDLLLYLPLNYADLSHITTINNLQVDQSYTVKAQVVSVTEYFKNHKRLTKAIIADETGRTQCMWFNNRFIKKQLKTENSYFFAGKYSQYHTFSQPKIEEIKKETLHTGRLVPRYSQTTTIAQGKMRLILKDIVSNLDIKNDPLSNEFNLLDLKTTFSQLHFPEKKELVIEARKRLAIEELLALIKQSHKSKQDWQNQTARLKLKLSENDINLQALPFKLTDDQQKSLSQIIKDLSKDQPMNRLLIGDVGSGKTVVAGVAINQILLAGSHTVLVAPTQILAQQHLQTFNTIFPHIKTQLITAKTNSKQALSLNQKTPTLFIGTHAVINQLATIKPALVVFDEQHRFGVAQRAEALQKETSNLNQKQPHILTMSATPIPRSYMLTIFSHLEVSLINQFPFGEKNIKSYVVPKHKQQDSYNWIVQQLKSQELSQSSHQEKPLAIIVCPFINPSENEAFATVPSATEVYEKLNKKWGQELAISLLHGKQKPIEQEKIIQKLFSQKINLLVTTSIVEVGVDLPQANIMLIEGADRFGLASLHQLRGRVGRKSQESYCLLISSSNGQESQLRLKAFAKENNGLKLAELDLQNRGPGDLFGLKQHGLDNLIFADWHNIELITQAKEIFNQTQLKAISWKPLFDNNYYPKKIINN